MQSQIKDAIVGIGLAALIGCAANDAQLEKGLAEYRAGRYEAAVEEFTLVLQKDPGYASAFLWRGHAYANLGRIDRAVADYQRSSELAPNSPDAYYGLGYLYAERREYEKAARLYTRALQADPSDFASHVERSKALFELRRYDDAVADLNEALDVKQDALLYGMRGAALMKLGRYDRALADYDRAIGAAPLVQGLLTDRADVHYARADYGKALQDLENEVAVSKGAAYAYNNLAWFLVTNPRKNLRDGPRAKSLVARAKEGLSSMPDSELELALYGTEAAVLAELGDYSAAVKIQETANGLAGKSTDALERGRVYLAEYKAKHPLALDQAQRVTSIAVE